MREAADASGRPEHSQAKATDPSVFGASENEKQAALASHRELLHRLRETQEQAPTRETNSEDATQRSPNQVGVELAPDENLDPTSMGPVDFARYLCEKGMLTTEQRGPVALAAKDMQIVFDAEIARRATLSDEQIRAEGIDAIEHMTLPLKGRRLRILLYGGGGCGKTRIINYVLSKLFRRFYGDKRIHTRSFLQ